MTLRKGRILVLTSRAQQESKEPLQKMYFTAFAEKETNCSKNLF